MSLNNPVAHHLTHLPSGSDALTNLSGKWKTVNQAVNNSGLTNDSVLFFPLLANRTYLVIFNLVMTTGAGDEQPILKWISPVGATYFGGAVWTSSTVTGQSQINTGSTFSPPQTHPLSYVGSGSIYVANGATAGNLQLQFGQNNPLVEDLTMLAGSCFSIIMVA